MGLSALNAHRKKYTFIPNGICSLCNSKSEDVKHFFLQCPAYAAQRQRLLHDMSSLLPDKMQPLLPNPSSRFCKDLIEIILYGTKIYEKDK